MIWIALLISLLSTSLYFSYLVRKKGLDPSLVTQSSVLGLINYRGGQILILSALLAYLVYMPAGRFLAYLVFFEAIFQILILYIFERQPTQPILYFVCLTAAGSCGFIDNKKLEFTVLIL